MARRLQGQDGEADGEEAPASPKKIFRLMNQVFLISDYGYVWEEKGDPVNSWGHLLYLVFFDRRHRIGTDGQDWNKHNLRQEMLIRNLKFLLWKKVGK